MFSILEIIFKAIFICLPFAFIFYVIYNEFKYKKEKLKTIRKECENWIEHIGSNIDLISHELFIFEYMDYRAHGKVVLEISDKENKSYIKNRAFLLPIGIDLKIKIKERI